MSCARHLKFIANVLVDILIVAKTKINAIIFSLFSMNYTHQIQQVHVGNGSHSFVLGQRQDHQQISDNRQQKDNRVQWNDEIVLERRVAVGSAYGAGTAGTRAALSGACFVRCSCGRGALPE